MQLEMELWGEWGEQLRDEKGVKGPSGAIDGMVWRSWSWDSSTRGHLREAIVTRRGQRCYRRNIVSQVRIDIKYEVKQAECGGHIECDGGRWHALCSMPCVPKVSPPTAGKPATRPSDMGASDSLSGTQWSPTRPQYLKAQINSTTPA